MHVCTAAIPVQMVVNFIIDLENNVRSKNFRADSIFRNLFIGPDGQKLSAKLLVRDQIFQDQNSSDSTRTAHNTLTALTSVHLWCVSVTGFLRICQQ